MPTTSSESTSNPWGEHPASAPARNNVHPKLKSGQVPDDWDNDDDEEELDNQRIWETANIKSPMPQLVISRSSTSATVVSPPPTAVIQAPMKILKRPTPTATPSNTSTASPSPVSQTITEREARYQEARERIFGPSKASEQDSLKTPSPTPPSKPVPNVIHHPFGPETSVPVTNSNPPQGFGGKRGRRPPKF